MIQPLPTLVFTADAECVLTADGRFLGICAAGGFLPCPVCRDGEMIFRAEPLEAGLLPVTRRVSIAGGRAECAGADVILWPGCCSEIRIALPRLPIAEGRPETLAALALSESRRLTLYRDRGLRLTLEDGGRPVAGCAAGDGELESMDVFECDGRRYIGLALEGRLLAFDAQLGCLLDTDCAKASFRDGRPAALRRLPTFRRHGTLTVYGFAGAAMAERLTEDGGAAREPADAPERAICCLEAVREGFFAEALTYMTRDLRDGLDLAAVRAFLGDFAAVRRPFDGDPAVLGLEMRKQGSPTEVRLLAIEYSDGLVDNIAES